MTLDEMKSQFTGIMNRRDLTANTALVSTFMNQAIMRVQRDMRVPAMEKIVEVTITADYAGLVIPNDLIELKEIRPEASEVRLRKDTLDRVKVAVQTSGTPQIYARQGGVYLLGPTPAVGDVIRLTYYTEIPAMTTGTSENVMSQIAWDLFVYAACVFAARYYVDKRKDDFEASYQEIKQALQDQADDDELGDDACVSACLVYPADDLIDEVI